MAFKVPFLQPKSLSKDYFEGLAQFCMEWSDFGTENKITTSINRGLCSYWVLFHSMQQRRTIFALSTLLIFHAPHSPHSALRVFHLTLLLAPSRVYRAD